MRLRGSELRHHDNCLVARFLLTKHCISAILNLLNTEWLWRLVMQPYRLLRAYAQTFRDKHSVHDEAGENFVRVTTEDGRRVTIRNFPCTVSFDQILTQHTVFDVLGVNAMKIRILEHLEG